jgi:hypothetical protein
VARASRRPREARPQHTATPIEAEKAGHA